MALYLGIDTSNYTTSLAVSDEKGQLIADHRKLLSVKHGDRGLRQSEAVFQHIKNFPLIFDSLFDNIKKSDIKAIGVSQKPRPDALSYMPVFQVGVTMGKVLAKSLDVPLVFTTHQEGHIMAGIWSCGQELLKKFMVLHISGGTTELLEVSLKEENTVRFEINLLGGTNDLHAGQFIDRVGVKMGLEFPAGPQLEQLARESGNHINFPVAVKGLNVSFSGPESHAQRLLDKDVNYSDVARGVENCLVSSLEKLILNGYAKTKLSTCLVVGGVASNKYLRKTLKSNLKDLNIFFAAPCFSSDNAVGVSLIINSGERRR